MSSPVHEEQHLRRSARKTRPQTGAVCRAEAWRWVLGFGDWLILGFRPRQTPGQRQRERERMAEGSKGRVYLRQVFPPGTDKARGGEVLGSR